MHTDETLKALDGVAERLANQLRAFVAETCPEFSTKELRREVEARRRRETRQNLSKNVAPPGNPTDGTYTSIRRPKTLNLRTYKLHALGDYSSQIRFFGTTDSYSTQPARCTISHSPLYSFHLFLQGEQEHRVGKGRYTRTSRKDYIAQLASIERRQARIRRISARVSAPCATLPEQVPNTPDEHHHIGKAQNDPEDLMIFVRRHTDDPAANVSLSMTV